MTESLPFRPGCTCHQVSNRIHNQTDAAHSVEDVNRLLKQFIQMKKMLKVVGGLGDGGGGKAAMRKKMGALKQMMQQHGR